MNSFRICGANSIGTLGKHSKTLCFEPTKMPCYDMFGKCIDSVRDTIVETIHRLLSFVLLAQQGDRQVTNWLQSTVQSTVGMGHGDMVTCS